jgi:cleavage and polyadenylation specificity factor subunit 3
MYIYMYMYIQHFFVVELINLYVYLLQGRIFMTHATKAVMQLMIADFVKLGGGNKSSSLYNDKDFKSCMDKIEVIDYHTTVTHKGIQFCGYVAGHVLGAAMFAISIDGVRVLYTGDYSMEEDR